MREVDREIELEAVVRIEPGPLVAVLHLDREQDAQEALRRLLLDDARRLQQEDEGSGAPVHDRDLRTGDIDVQVVDAQSGECRHQVLDGGNRGAVARKRRGQPRIAHVQRVGGDGDRAGEIHAMEHDSRVRRRRAKDDFDPGPGVETDAGGLVRDLEGPLLQHVVLVAGRLAPQDTAIIPPAVQWFRRILAYSTPMGSSRGGPPVPRRDPLGLGGFSRISFTTSVGAVISVPARPREGH